MTREIMLKIITGELYSALFVIIISFLLCWWTLFELSYLFLGVKVSTKQMIPAIFLMMIFSFFSKQILHMALAGVIMPFLMALLLYFTVKSNYLKAFWVALVTIFISNICPIVITYLLCALNPRINSFFLQSPWGVAVGTWLENLGPALALFILPKLMPRFKYPLMPPIAPKPTQLEFWIIFTYSSMYAMNFLAWFIVYVSLMQHYHFLPLVLVVLWCSAITSTLGHYRFVKTLTETYQTGMNKLETEKNNLKADKTRLEAEKQQIEIERNQLQVEKDNLKEEKSRLEDIKNNLEKERDGLLNQVQEIEASNEEGVKSRKLLKAFDGFIRSVQNIIPIFPVQNDNFTYKTEPDTINIISGKSDEEITQILGLTPRELDIVRLICQGMSTKEMPGILDLSEGTISNHISFLLQKYGVKDRTDLLIYIMLRLRSHDINNVAGASS